jgi:transcriptional regulator of arginine metabolism
VNYLLSMMPVAAPPFPGFLLASSILFPNEYAWDRPFSIDIVFSIPHIYALRCIIMRTTPKRLRQNRILQLIAREPMLTQEHLAHRLAQEGLRVTQATLSRDIKELRLVKTPEGYAVPGAPGEAPAPHLPSLSHLLREFVVDIRTAQNLLVLRTPAGSAQPVAAALDAQGWPELVGTLAGDDTILAVSSSAQACRLLSKKIRELMS